MRYLANTLIILILIVATKAKAQGPEGYAQKLQNNGEAWLLKGTDETLGRRGCANGEYLRFYLSPSTFLRRTCNMATHAWDTTKGNWSLKILPGNKLFITLSNVEYRAYINEDSTTVNLTLATQKRRGSRRDVVIEQHFVAQKN